MVQIALTDGTYQARSVIASAQRCVNLFPEVNQLNKTLFYPQQQTNSIITHYPTPGLRKLATVGNGPIRCLFRASNNAWYCVSGSEVYSIATDYTATKIGDIQLGSSICRMADNGTTAVLVDGTTNGYTIKLSDNTWTQIADSAFYGADWVDYIDTYMLFNKPGSGIFYSTTSEVVTPFDSLYFASKVAKPDLLVAPVVMHDEIWLIGQRTSEVWYNSGGADFPFQKVPGAFVQHGCMAKYSIAVQNLQIYWLSQNDQGERVVLCGENYNVSRISTHAIEADIAGYASCDDAIGFIYQQQGHQYYVLIFPSANKTWVYDTQTQLWHERMYLSAGQETRIRPNCCAVFGDDIVVGDWEDGRIYAYDPDVYTDDGDAIERIRSFPTLQNELKRVSYSRFVADMEVGEGSALTPATPQIWTTETGDPILAVTGQNQFQIVTNATDVAQGADENLVALRYSDTGGQDWNDPEYQSLGAAGQYDTNLQWQRLGVGRRRVFELRWSAAQKTALNGAYIDVEPGRR